MPSCNTTPSRSCAAYSTRPRPPSPLGSRRSWQVVPRSISGPARPTSAPRSARRRSSSSSRGSSCCGRASTLALDRHLRSGARPDHPAAGRGGDVVRARGVASDRAFRCATGELIALPGVAQTLVEPLTASLGEKQENLSNFASARHIVRVRRKLLQLARNYGRVVRDGVRIDFPISHSLLAEMVGVPRDRYPRPRRAPADGLYRPVRAHLPAARVAGVDRGRDQGRRPRDVTEITTSPRTRLVGSSLPTKGSRNVTVIGRSRWPRRTASAMFATSPI